MVPDFSKKIRISDYAMNVPPRIASLTQLLVGFSPGQAEEASDFYALFSRIPQRGRFALARIGSGLGLVGGSILMRMRCLSLRHSGLDGAEENQRSLKPTGFAGSERATVCRCFGDQRSTCSV
jgi:hypothetical protein